MIEPIVSRETIANHAEEAARRMAQDRTTEPNPYPAGTAAAREWKASLERYLLVYSAACAGAEGSA